MSVNLELRVDRDFIGLGLGLLRLFLPSLFFISASLAWNRSGERPTGILAFRALHGEYLGGDGVLLLDRKVTTLLPEECLSRPPPGPTFGLVR